MACYVGRILLFRTDRQVLLEPVVGVGLGVEGAAPRGSRPSGTWRSPRSSDRLVSSRTVRLPAAAARCSSVGEQAPADAEARERVGATHMRFSSVGFVAVEPQRAAADRLAPQRRHQEQPGRRAHLVQVDGTGLRSGRSRSSKRRSSSAKYAWRQCWAWRWAGSTASISTRAAVSSDSTSPIAATRRSRWPAVSGSSSERARASLRRSSTARSARPFLVSVRGADAPVGGAGADGDQPVGLERAQEPAEVAGVEVEPGAQRRARRSRPRRSPTARAPRRAGGRGPGTGRGGRRPAA